MSTTIYDKVQKMTVALLTVLLIAASQCFPALASSVDLVEVSSAPMERSISARNGMVRVYLSSMGNPSALDLTIRGKYSLSHNDEFLLDGTSVRVSFSSSTGNITLTYSGKTVQVGKRIVFRRHNTSGTNGILISQSREPQNPYPGDLSLESVYQNGSFTLYPIVHVYIENYLYGVLPYEMGNSSPMEALKAQAVAARTYTVRMMEARSSGLYDVKDTTSDQVYRGTPSGNANCVAAIDATKGIVLMHGSSYITTFYSASNGGQTEISRNGTQYAYMKVKDDPFDYANSASTVKKKTLYSDLNHSANPSQLISLLKSKAVASLKRSGYASTSENTQLKTLQNVVAHTPMYPYPSRVYTKIDFTFTVSTQNSSGHSIISTLTETLDIFSEVESMLGMGIQSANNELWSVEKGDGTFVLEARRFGHGMGMSQRGAMQMAKLGYTYDEILGFYFEGCRRKQHSFTNSILNESTSDQEITVEPPADLEEDSFSCKGTVVLSAGVSEVTLRSSPAENASVIGYVANGAIVSVFTSNSTWSQIKYGELIGYVPTSALLITGAPSEAEQQTSIILGLATVKANDYVNLRQSGSTGAKILGTAPAGAKLTVLSSNGSWARVQYKSLVAYVNTNYISMVSAPATGETTEIRKAVVMTESGTGTVNLRKSPSTSAQILNRITVGTVVSVRSEDDAWCFVSTPVGSGYMMSSFLRNENNVPPAEDDETTEPEETVSYAVVSTQQGSLNLRAHSRTDSAVLATIPKGTKLLVKTKGEVWSAVRYGSHNGYVMTCYLSFETDDSIENQQPSDEMVGGLSARVVTPSGSLNLRAQPNLNAQILALIPPDTVVKVLEKGTEWSAVHYRNVRGHVMSRFLLFESDGQNDSSGTEETDDNEYPDLSVPGEADTAYVHTQSGSLNLRRQPSLNSVVLTAIPRNAAVTISARGDEWCAVSYRTYTGFVMTKYLSFSTPSQTPAFDEYRDEPAQGPENVVYRWVNTESGSLNLRRGADANSVILATIPRLTQLDVLSVGSEWCYVSYGLHEGYVMTRYLSETNPALSMQTEANQY